MDAMSQTSDIQTKIRDYLGGKPPSRFTLLCFAGMLETGEATLEDFRAAGGHSLAIAVREFVGKHPNPPADSSAAPDTICRQ